MNYLPKIIITMPQNCSNQLNRSLLEYVGYKINSGMRFGKRPPLLYITATKKPSWSGVTCISHSTHTRGVNLY